MCDLCMNWYHKQCIEFEDESENLDEIEYQCNKCKFWIDHIQSPLLDIMLKRKTCKQLINEDLSEWKIETLTYNSDTLINSEQKIFDHILMARCLQKLAEYVLTEVSSSNLIDFLEN